VPSARRITPRQVTWKTTTLSAASPRSESTSEKRGEALLVPGCSERSTAIPASAAQLPAQLRAQTGVSRAQPGVSMAA